MISPTTLALMQRLAQQHGTAGGQSPQIAPAGGGQPSSGGGLAGLLGGLTGGPRPGRAQTGPDQGQAPSGPLSGLASGFGDKLVDFGIGAALGGKNWYQSGLTGLYGGIASRREQKAAQAELNRTRQVAISMGIPEDIAANAPPDVLASVIKEAYQAGLKPITLSKGQKAFDAKGAPLADNPDDSIPEAKYITLQPPDGSTGLKPRTFDVSDPKQREQAQDYTVNRQWTIQRAESAQPSMQTREIDGVVYNWNPQTGELGKPLGKASAKGQSVPQAVQTDLIKAKQAYGTINNALDRFETAAKSAGTMGATMPGAAKDAVSEERRNVQLMLKEMYNLGVLNGPDLELMNQMLFDPSLDVLDPIGSVSKLYGGTEDRVKASVDRMKLRLKEMVESKIAVVKESASQNGGGAEPAPPPDVDPAIWEVMTPEERGLWQPSQ